MISKAVMEKEEVSDTGFISCVKDIFSREGSAALRPRGEKQLG